MYLTTSPKGAPVFGRIQNFLLNQFGADEVIVAIIEAFDMATKYGSSRIWHAPVVELVSSSSRRAVLLKDLSRPLVTSVGAGERWFLDVERHLSMGSI